MSEQSPQWLLQRHPDLKELLSAHWQAVAESDVLSDLDIPAEVVGGFEDNLNDMTKEDALEAMWSLVGTLLSKYRVEHGTQRITASLPSKIVQINSIAIPSGPGDYVELLALCEDGSLWMQFHSNGRANVPSDGRWHEMHPASW